MGGEVAAAPTVLKSLCLCRYLYLCVRYLLAVYLCYSSVKISVPVICYLCVYIGLGDAALATISMLKILLQL